MGGEEGEFGVISLAECLIESGFAMRFLIRNEIEIN